MAMYDWYGGIYLDIKKVNMFGSWQPLPLNIPFIFIFFYLLFFSSYVSLDLPQICD